MMVEKLLCQTEIGNHGWQSHYADCLQKMLGSLQHGTVRKDVGKQVGEAWGLMAPSSRSNPVWLHSFSELARTNNGPGRCS